MIGNGSDRGRWWWWWCQVEPDIVWDLVRDPALCLGGGSVKRRRVVWFGLVSLSFLY